jgi:hypothetical protein
VNDQTGRQGVYLVAQVAEDMNWIFREQSIEDQGIDAHIEAAEILTDKRGGSFRRGTGRLIAVQIKSGPTQFDDISPEGWWFRFDDVHARLWLNHSLPVVVMLANVVNKIVYWQEISPRTVQSAGNSFKVEVPATQELSSASAALEELSADAARIARAMYESSKEHLSPSVVKVFEAIEDGQVQDAALLAYYLAEGRNNAAGVVSSLLATTPIWITRNEGWAWRALGNFAASHGLGRLAVEAFALGGRAEGPDAGRCFAGAALHALEHDRVAAEGFTTLAEEHGASKTVTASLRAVLNHPAGDAAPIPMPVELELDSEETRGCAVAQGYLCIQAKRRGDVQAALRHSSLMLTAEPKDTVAMMAKADAIMWSAVVGPVDSSLLNEAIALLERVVRERRRWSGPTSEATVALARARLQIGDFEGMLQTCLAPPSGTASADDSASPEVRHLAIYAAALLHKVDVVESLTELSLDSPEAQLARYRIGLLDLSEGEVTDLLLDELKGAIGRDDYLRVAQTVIDLARLGVDALASLDPYVERSIVSSETYELGRSLIAIYRDLDAGLPGLRALGRTDKQAAEILVRTLRGNGRHREAVDACDAILAQGDDPLFTILRALALTDLDDSSAEMQALDAVGRTAGFPVERGRLLTYAASKAADRKDWVTAERRLSDVLDVWSTPDAGSVWRLVTAQLNLGHLDRAVKTIDRYQPEVRDDHEAKLWLHATGAEPWDASRASEALSLSSRVDDPRLAAALLNHIVTTTHGVSDEVGASEGLDSKDLEERRIAAQRTVPGELHRRAFQALGALAERYGDEMGVKILRGEPDNLTEQIVAMLKPGEDRQRFLMDLMARVHDSALPMGLIATISGNGYASLLVQRAFGPLTAASPDDDEYCQEFEAARASLNGKIVVDASSLLTASGLENISLVAQFSRIIVPAATLTDIHRAVNDVRAMAGSPGRIGWDGSAGGIRLVTTSNEEFVRQLRRVESLDRSSSSLPVGTPTQPDIIDGLDDRAGSAPWVDPLQLAHENDCALWCDDLGLRRLASALGVASFGTGSLVDALREQEIGRVDSDALDAVLEVFESATRDLAVDLVVDLPLGSDDLLRLAELGNWLPGPGTVAIARQSWWVWQGQAQADPFGQVITVLRRVAAENRAAVPAWQSSAMVGAAHGLKPELAPRGLCELALMPWGSEGSDSDVLMGIAQARSVAHEFGLKDPADEVSAAAAHLADRGFVADPEDLASRVIAAVEQQRSAEPHLSQD